MDSTKHTDSGPARTSGFTNFGGTKEGSAVVDIGMGLREGGRRNRPSGREGDGAVL
jgi:hypothetical protein